MSRQSELVVWRVAAAILATLALAAAYLAFAPVVTATGDCVGGGYVIFSSGPNNTGNFRVYCYGVNDVDMESEPGNVMGPMNDGSYQNDFDSGSTTSGISSVRFSDINNTSHGVCFYTGKNYGGSFAGILLHHGQTKNFTGSQDNALGSFRFISAGTSCPSPTGG